MRAFSSLFFNLVVGLVILSYFPQTATAQLTGTKNIPGDYADLAAAITDLNTQGVGVGGVTLNLVAGNPQTAPAGGYVIGGTGSAVLATASSTNTITLLGNSNVITASAALTAGALNDAIFKLIGADWTTIMGFTMEENAANTVTAAATNNMTEFGVALLYVTTTDNANNVTIQNNTIDLNRTYQNTFGIYANATHSATAVTTSATATGANGGNHNLLVRNNTVQDVNNGILVLGPTAAADQNTGVLIGGSGNGNTITNYANTGTFSSFANVSGTIYGILMRNSKGFEISYNQISSNPTGNTAGTLRGIYNVSASNAPTGTFTNTISNNTISLVYGVASGTMQGITVESTNANTTSTGNIDNNTFTSLTASLTSSVAITAISAVAAHLNVSISGNNLSNITTNTTGSFTFISHGYTVPVGGTQNISNNAVGTAFNKTGAGGTVTFMTSGSSSISALSVTHSNNNFSNVTVTGATGISGISSSDGLSTIALNRTVNNNTFDNWTGGTSAITAMSYSYWGGTTSSLSNNTISNITGQGSITGITIGSSGNNANPLNISQNTIFNLNSTGTGGAVTGITCSNTSAAINIAENNISMLASTGASAVNGISITGASNTTVSKNKICDLSGSNASSTVNGINVTSGTTVTLTNNRIGDLRATNANAANPINGINITGGTNVNVYYNSVAIAATSAGALFGSSAINASTTPTLTVRNNIFVNTSTPNGAGIVAAYRRSTTTLTSYNSASNNNLFYAGTPSATNVIFYDGTNSDQTLALYKTRVAPRDAASVTEAPNFVTTLCASGGFLRINAAIASQIESGGANISGITDDYAGDIRFGNPGYSGTGSAPDIGADEFNGTPVDLNGPVITYSNFGATSCLVDRTLSATITDPSGVNTTAGTKPRLYFKKSTDANTYVGNTNADNGWKYVEASNAASPFNFTTNYSLLQSAVVVGDVIQYFVVAQDLSMTPNVGINSGTFNATPTSVALTAAEFPLTGTINDYTLIAAGLTGTVNVGASETYTTLTGAGGLFATINSGGLSGNVTAIIMDASITETGANALNAINYNGCSAGPYTLTIKPNTAATLTGSVGAGSIIKLNGADYVTIDGSNSGGTDRSLTIQNTTTTTSGNAVVWLAAPAVGNGSNNNTVKNCIIEGNASTTSFTCLHVGGNTTLGLTTAGLEVNSNNTIQNNLFRKAQYGVTMFGYNASFPDQNNSIQSNNFGTSTAGEGFSLIGLNADRQLNLVVSGNEVQNVRSSTTTSNMFGIRLLDFKNGLCYNNNVHDIVYTGTSTAKVYGIGVQSSTYTTSGNPSNAQIYNNTVSNINASGTSTLWVASGIIANAGYGDKYYHNSVHMTGQVSNSTTGNSSAFANGDSGNLTTFCNNIEVRNNIFSITGTTSATGGNFWAFYNKATNTTGATINNNVYYCIVTGTSPTNNIGSLNATNYATLATWQAATMQDASSFNVSVPFTSSTDLHINAGMSQSVLESNGAVVGVGTDIDGQVRPGPAGSMNGGGTAPDIGADEFDGVPAVPMTYVSSTTTQNNTSNVPTNASNQEVIGVQIVVAGELNPLSVTSITMNTNGTTNTADITNAKVWYTGTSSTFATTTQYGSTIAMPSGSLVFSASQTLATPGTYYFWLSYDLPCGVTVSNVIDGECNSITIGGAQIPSVQAPAGSRTIVAGPLSGLYTVGTGGNYNTLTEAATDINTKGLSGSVQLRILNDLNEPGAVVINQWTECGGSGFTLTIRPQSATTPTITANSTTSVIKLNGADRVTIDGSNSGGTSRDLTILNTNTSATTGVVWISSLGAAAGATNNILKNCILKTGSNTVSTYAVAVSGTSLASTGADNNNITIENNWIQKANYGIYATGVVTTGELTGLVINNNKIGGDLVADYITGYGTYMTGASGPMITGNEVYNMIYDGSKYGMWFGTTVHDAVLSKNNIHSMGQTNTTSTYYCIGIYFSSSTSNTNNQIDNNFIYDLHQYGSTSNFYYCGIRITGSSNFRLYYNTINITGAFGSATAGVYANCLFVSTASTNMDIRNNIFSNTRTGNAPKAYTIHTVASTTYANINYNDYYSSGAALGLIGGTEVANFAALQAATTQDANSVNIQPVYFSDTNVHLFPASNPTLNGLGTPIGGITTDIDGDTRNGSTPDMGGDEWEPSTDQVDWCNLQWPPTGSIYPHNSYNTFGQAYEAGITDGPGQATGLLAWIGVSNANSNPNTWANDAWIPATFNVQVGNNDEFIGTIPSNSLAPGTYYYAFRYSLNYGPYTYGGYSAGGGGFWDGSTYVSGVLTVNSCPTITPSATPTTICVGETSTLNVMSSNNDYTYLWNPGMLVGAMQIVNPTSTTLYTVTATDNMTGCVVTSNQTVTVVPLPTVGISPAGPINISCGTVQALTGSVAANVKDYLFTPSSGTFTPITGGTDVNVIEDDDTHSSAIPLGFSFTIEGNSYSNLYANSNGWLSFNTSSGTATTTQWRTNISTAPASMLPLIAPLWDDLDGIDAPGQAKYITEGSAPNRVFTFEWLNWEWYFTADAPVLSFQVKLYESTNKIEFIYRQEANAPVSPTGSIGLITSSSNYLMLDGTGATPMALSNTFTTSLSAKPATGQIYAFEPPMATNYLWSGPSGTLFTDIAATMPYTGQNIGTVYAKPNTSGTNSYMVTVTDGNGCENTASRDIEVGPCNVSLGLTAYIEGFMNGGVMQSVLLNSGIMGAMASQCDTITVSLHNNMAPYAKAYEYKGVLGVNGTLNCTFPAGANGNSYYIVVTHRNALETWSAMPQTITGSNTYNFSTGSGQAFGGNMVQVGSLWCFYSGNIDGTPPDDNIDLVDYPVWETDYNNFLSGYYRTDLNGDGVIDLIDYPIWETNANNFISVFRP